MTLSFLCNVSPACFLSLPSLFPLYFIFTATIVTYVDPALSGRIVSLGAGPIKSHTDTLDWMMVTPCGALSGP